MITVQEIIPFIDEHWEQLTNAPRRVKHTWHSSIAKTMVRFFLPFIVAVDVLIWLCFCVLQSQNLHSLFFVLLVCVCTRCIIDSL